MGAILGRHPGPPAKATEINNHPVLAILTIKIIHLSRDVNEQIRRAAGNPVSVTSSVSGAN
jgi:hypothetical protein